LIGITSDWLSEARRRTTANRQLVFLFLVLYTAVVWAKVSITK
jgi:hypothetical protein